jgi:hypothetical protein
MKPLPQPTDSINPWSILLTPVEMEEPLNLKKRAKKITGSASLTYQRDPLILPAKPRVSKKQEIIWLFDKGNNVNAIQLITGYGLKYIRKTLIAKNKLSPVYNRNGRRQIAVIQRSPEGEYIAEFASISEAGRKLEIDMETIRKVCNGDPRRKTAGGFKFEFKWLK